MKNGQRSTILPSQLSACVVYVTLYAPYVAMPHIRIMRREMAVAMQMSAEEKRHHNNAEDNATATVTMAYRRAAARQDGRPNLTGN